jgi:phospholipid/cholesterol/gamma-HCH transport system substrate-binding protein
VANLLTVSRILEPRQSNLDQILVAYPGVSSVAPTVVPGDGSAHLGLLLNIFDPLPCTKGYEATPRRAGNEVADTPVNAQAHCAEPYYNPIDVAGRTTPQAGGPAPPRRPGVRRTASAETTSATTGDAPPRPARA